jgi:hypothetical protein
MRLNIRFQFFMPFVRLKRSDIRILPEQQINKIPGLFAAYMHPKVQGVRIALVVPAGTKPPEGGLLGFP